MVWYDLTWIENGVLAASSWPETYLADLYPKFHIQAVINLDNPYYYAKIPPELTVYLIKIVDGSIPTEAQLTQFLEITEKHERAQQPILVHCIGGHGRTGTMVAIWGVYTHRVTLDQDPIAWIRSKRQGSIETAEQEAFVTEWTENFRNRTRSQ